MRFVGITGGIGSGKSVVMNYLSTHTNCEIVYADDLAKELYAPGTKLNTAMREAFSKEKGYSEELFLEDGAVNSPVFVKEVLSDDTSREKLNALVHPAVKEDVLRRVKEHREKKDIDYFFLEAALLIEDGYKQLCDELWYVSVTEENRKARLKENRGYTDERIDEAFAMQLQEYEFLDACCVVIDNNGSEEETYAQLERILSLRKPRTV